MKNFVFAVFLLLGVCGCGEKPDTGTTIPSASLPFGLKFDRVVLSADSFHQYELLIIESEGKKYKFIHHLWLAGSGSESIAPLLEGVSK